MNHRMASARRGLGALGVGLGVAVILAAFPARADDAPLSAAAVYRAASDGVVFILGLDQEKRTAAHGAGTIIGADGTVVTNAHVIMDPRTNKPYHWLTVFLKPAEITGESENDLARGFQAQVVGVHVELDVAVLRMQRAPAGLVVVPFGDSEQVEVGEGVAAIGHPGGGGMWTLTVGTVSSKRRQNNREVFQTDAALNPGNSGGPLLDRDARIVGINTHIVRQDKQGMALEGLNYAVRSGAVVRWMQSQGIAVNVAQRGAAVAVAVAQAKPQPQPAAKPQPQPQPQPAAKSQPQPAAKSQPQPQPQPQASGSREPRPFPGPAGERFYGVPNPKMDMSKITDYLRRKVAANAEGAFEDLEIRTGPSDPR